MPRGVIVTYSRRHQLRQVKAEKDESWGNVIGKSKEDAVFGSSFSSGIDSSGRNSDLSIELPGPKPRRRNRKYGNKENIDATYQRRGLSKKREKMFSLSDGTENTSSELDSSGNKQKPLRDKNAGDKSTGQPQQIKGALRANKKRRKEKDNAEEHTRHYLESSIEQERREVDVKNQFAEFEEFSLCIEEEKAEEHAIVINAPPNLTPSSTCSSIANALPNFTKHSPQMHTSTPQMSRKPVENLFRRLTRSNLKKMTNSVAVTPLSISKYQVSKSSTPGCENEEPLSISPACSNISRRESVDSEYGNKNFNDTLESIVNISASISHQINTRRRTRQQTTNSDLLGMSSINSPGLSVFTPSSVCGRPIDHIAEQSEFEMSHEEKGEDHVEDEEGDVYHEQPSLEEIEAATDFAEKIDELHLSLCDEPTEQKDYNCSARSYQPEKSIDIYHECESVVENKTVDYSFDPVANSVHQFEKVTDSEVVKTKNSVFQESKNSSPQFEGTDSQSKVTPVRDFDIVLERLSDSLVSQLTNSGKSVIVKDTISVYDASKSLFDDCDLTGASRRIDLSSVYETAEEEMTAEHSVAVNLHQKGYSSEDDIQSVGSCDGTSEDSDANSDFELARVQPHVRALSVIEEFNESCRSFQCLTPIRSRSSGRVLPPRIKVLSLCDQDEPITFSEFIPTAMMRKCVKIGEGVYGEVFRSQTRQSSIALKVIPIEGSFSVNDEPQKTFAEVLPEIVISQSLSDLNCDGDNVAPNFVQLNRCGIIQGCYPDHLLKEWDRFYKKKGSENDRPDMFPKTQLFLMFDFEDSGTDLEGFEFKSLLEARSVLHQVTLSLAVAEMAVEFEHRDLHWGNVLIKRTEEDILYYKLDGDSIEIETHSVKAAVIDFTLSRIKKDGVIAFNNLALDPTMFEGHGDYQFDVYRAMRDETEDNWEPFHPYTNVLWLHYLADKLFNHKTYPGATSKQHKALSRQFRTLIREMTDYNSAVHLVSCCPFFSE